MAAHFAIPGETGHYCPPAFDRTATPTAAELVRSHLPESLEDLQALIAATFSAVANFAGDNPSLDMNTCLDALQEARDAADEPAAVDMQERAADARENAARQSRRDREFAE